LPARSILNHCDSDRVPFSWTVNPYRGCEFGCQYCYARYTHEYMELDGADFERKIYVKQDTGPLAGRDLSIEKVKGEHIAIGTATDPYQPAEREFGATRAILEQMATRHGLSVSITTKSNLVVRDLDLLRRIAEHSSIHVNMTVTTLRPRLARMLEPRAPRPDLRLEAVRQLRAAGISAGVFAMPVLPGLTDAEADLDALARAARAAGAQWFAASVLFLMPSAQKQFLPFINAKFPKLARRYREWYSRSNYAPETYRREISARVAALRRKYGLGGLPIEPEKIAGNAPQLNLGFELTA
jgi:DNA repair photolyase